MQNRQFSFTACNDYYYDNILARCSAGRTLPARRGSPVQGGGAKVSRNALERTLHQQLFGNPDGRYFLKGNAQSACGVYADDARLTFAQDRILVSVKTHARLGQPVGGACLGLSLSPTAEVAMEPYGEGETIGFRNAQTVKVSDQRELNFLLTPFLSRQVPKSMKVNAADLLRNALTGSTANSGYKVTLDRLKIHSVQIEGDDLVVDADGDITVR
ncbi:MAG: hypothetical protein WCC26_02095 [Terracidiphilus sp.]